MMPESSANRNLSFRCWIAQLIGSTAVIIFLAWLAASWATAHLPFTDRFDPASVPSDDELIADFRENRPAYDQARVHFLGHRIRIDDPSHLTVMGDCGGRQCWQRRGSTWTRAGMDAQGARQESGRASKADAALFQTLCDDFSRLDAQSVGDRLYAYEFGQFAVCKFDVGNVASSVTKRIVYSETPPSYGVKLVDSTDGMHEQKGMYCRSIEDGWYVCIEFH